MRIAVIGAGASGLPAIKSALEENCEVICYEMASDIGGLWNYKPDPCPGEGSVMKSTVINTSKEMTSYSDFPAPSEYANYMHNSQLLKYFRMYAEHFDLLKHVRFNHEVKNIERSEKYDETGEWKITVLDRSTNNTTIELFDGVMVCTGHHTHEYWPQPWKGQNLFKGKIMHSHEYKDHRGFEDKVVVVVGVGNSGCDIAVELSKISSQVYLSTRSGAWVINRVWQYGEPTDLNYLTRAAFAFKKIIPWKVLCSAMEKKVNGRFDHGRYGLKPDHRILAAHVTINDELPNRIASGTVQVKPNIASFTEHGVVFDDDTIVEHVDIVVLATGYSFGFPIVGDGRLIEVKENRANLYKYMYPPELSDKNSLAVIGLIQPTGSILPLSEIQTRLFMSVLKGRTKVPNQVNMIKDIESKRRQMEREFVASRRHTIQVYYPSYMDEIAELYGCKPKIFRRCFTDPMLAYHLIFYGLVPYQYRLDGDHSWKDARRAILTFEQRVFETTRTRKTRETMKTKPTNKLITLVRLIF